MSPRKLYLLIPLSLLIFTACEDDDLTPGDELDIRLEHQLMQKGGDEGLAFFRLPDSDDYDNIPQDPLNPITSEKVALGADLFHETALGLLPKKDDGRQTYSCASCHHAAAGFQAGIRQGLGEGGLGFGLMGEGRHFNPSYAPEELDVQPIRTPSAMNQAYQEAMLWNGQFGAQGVNVGTDYSWTPGTPKENNELGYAGLETQAIAGLSVHRMEVLDMNVAELECDEDFDRAFPDFPKAERYTKETAGLAIAAYERTLLSNQAPFQLWLRGDKNAMTGKEKQGAMLFFGKAGCDGCHTGPSLSTMQFNALGMGDLEGPDVFLPNMADAESAKKGRGGFTLRNEDMFAFKVPQLYNLKGLQFFGHGGTFNTVKEVVEYKNAAVPENASVPNRHLDPAFVPLNLTDEEIDALTAFIEDALYDPSLDRYVPDQLFSGLCFPNNDDESRNDLGCN